MPIRCEKRSNIDSEIQSLYLKFFLLNCRRYWQFAKLAYILNYIFEALLVKTKVIF